VPLRGGSRFSCACRGLESAATIGPGLTIDEQVEHLSEKLSLTSQFKHLHDAIEPKLTQLRNPRDAWAHR
jgi:hypothetical protein